MSEKVIYSMVGVGKSYGPNQRVLRDISLGFFLGAKIGVLGLNGAGKSTLLRIMAGEESQFDGETILAEGYTRGFLPPGASPRHVKNGAPNRRGGRAGSS